VIIILINYMIKLLLRLNNEKSCDEIDTNTQLSTVSLSLDEIREAVSSFKSPMNKLQNFMSGSSQAGTFSEWSLKAIIQDFMPNGLYEQDWRPDPNEQKKVEFAIKLQNNLYLPIDSKFPSIEYERYINAANDGDKEAAIRHKKEIRRFVIDEAKEITKYIQEGRTPNLAYMYVPSEDLLRVIHTMKHEATGKPLIEYLASLEKKVLIVGPNILASELSILLSSQQRIEMNNKADEVLQKLNAVEREFNQFKASTDAIDASAEKLLNKIQSNTTRVNQMQRAIENMKDLSSENNDTT
jgi:DNA recombination protein RmuC